ncbi:MAG: flagellar hook basal-body protein [Candidatus Margulisiibacteriota bacterium]
MKDRILRISGADLEVSDERVKALVNDMVNAKTPAYQKSEIVTRAFPIELQSAIDRQSMRSSMGAMEPKIEGTFYSHIKGSLIKTGGKLDVALGGDGYLVVEGSNSGMNNEMYTRDGRFTVDTQGNLLTVAGNYKVMGQNGPITLDLSENVTINPEGKIMVDGEEVAILRVVNIANTGALQPVTGSFYKAAPIGAEISEDANPQVIQGYIETSNVSVVDQMMDLIFLSKKYGLSTKVVQSRDVDLSAALKMGEMGQ